MFLFSEGGAVAVVVDSVIVVVLLFLVVFLWVGSGSFYFPMFSSYFLCNGRKASHKVVILD